MNMSSEDPVTQCVEAMCQCGCEAVRASISALELGQSVVQVEGFDAEQRARLLAELKAIMAVYDRR